MLADSVLKPQPLPVKPVAMEVSVAQAAQPLEQAPAKRPVFTSMQDRYAWLMHNMDRWTDADRPWVERFVESDLYADLHTYFEARLIAWPGYAKAAQE